MLDDNDTITMSQENYQKLLEAYRQNKESRGPSLEEFRIWCEANKGVSTVSSGLLACTPLELYSAMSVFQPASLWVAAGNLCWEAARRLDLRTAKAERERAQAWGMERIAPEDDADG